MKVWFDKNASNRNFKPGDKVLLFQPISGHPLRARYYGPYEIESKISNVNYVVSMKKIVIRVPVYKIQQFLLILTPKLDI